MPSCKSGWAIANGLTPGVNDGRTVDADGSGLPNGAEFFLNGDPLSASDNGMVASFIAPAGALGEHVLVLTFAAPASTDFAGGASAGIDGVACTVEGSLDLLEFDVPVSEVSPSIIPADWPQQAPAGWQYHSFRLDAPEASQRGFLRLRFD